MKVIILAAGYAVRLQPLTLNTPKPLLLVGRKRIIDRILENVTNLKDISSICIITNAKFFLSFTEWQKSSQYKNKIHLISDGSTSNENRQGAIRDLEIAASDHAINEDMLVIAGDNLFDFDLAAFLDFAKSHSDGVSVALHDIKDLSFAKNFGVVKVDEQANIINFEEKPENPKSALVSTGIYYFPKDKRSFIKEYVKAGKKIDAPGHYISWLAKVDKVYGFTFLEDWCDIGNIESYEKANEKYSKKEKL